jgi:hypothetical protein
MTAIPASSEVYDQLVEAIRRELQAELVQEVIDHLTAYRDSDAVQGMDDAYIEGINDAITTAEELL